MEGLGEQDNTEELEFFEDQVNLLTNINIRYDDKLEELNARLLKLEMSSMQNNVIVTGVDETPNENLGQIVDKLFEQTLGVGKIEVVELFRMGQGTTRPILGKLANHTDKRNLFLITLKS